MLVLHHDGHAACDVQDVADMPRASLDDAFAALDKQQPWVLRTHSLQHVGAGRPTPDCGQMQSNRALCGIC